MSNEQAIRQDVEAALDEIESNLSVRRLMVVVVNVLVPTLSMGLVSSLCGTNYPEQLRWLPANALWITGAVLLATGLATSAVLGRCHFGLVVNGCKLQAVREGQVRPRGLNWLGVTTNFLALTAFTAAAGLALIGGAFGQATVFGLGGSVLIAALCAWLLIQHRRASRLAEKLAPSWTHGPIPKPLLERHAKMSLDTTSADISVVVTMAAALFAGTFDAMTSLGSLATTALGTADIESVQRDGMIALSGFTLVSLLLTSRIVVRLRIALAEHSAALAALREEPDQPYRFRPTERTFLLFLIVTTLAATSGLILGWTLRAAWLGASVGGLVVLSSLLWYPLQLRAASRKATR